MLLPRDPWMGDTTFAFAPLPLRSTFQLQQLGASALRPQLLRASGSLDAVVLGHSASQSSSSFLGTSVWMQVLVLVEPLPIAIVVAVRPDEANQGGVQTRPSHQRLRRPVRRLYQAELSLQPGERQHAVLLQRVANSSAATPSIWCPP